MRLLFTNDSKQIRMLIVTDFVEDIYDEIEAFFEEHRIMPHIIDIREAVDGYELWFGSMSEHFIIEKMPESEMEELKAMYACG